MIRQALPVLILLATVQVQAKDMHARELAAIQFVESSGGINLNHALIEKGIHKGTRAGGHYGIMPLTAKHLVKNSPELYKKYGNILDWTNNQVTAALNKHRNFDKDLARYFWKQIRSKHAPASAACRWFRGPASKKCDDPVLLSQDEYVQKFKDSMKTLETTTVARNP